MFNSTSFDVPNQLKEIYLEGVLLDGASPNCVWCLKTLEAKDNLFYRYSFLGRVWYLNFKWIETE